MEHNPPVSIIMNCYNSERFLKEAIDSVYAQTYQNWEIIFWDNASTDSSGEIAQSYDEKVQYYLAKTTTPLGEARNVALQKASGTYIAFLDCDDLYEPDKLQLQVGLLESNPFAMCYGSALTINEDGKIIKRTQVTNTSGENFGNLLQKYEINMQSVLLRRKIFDESDLSFSTNLQYCPDNNLFMNIAARYPIGVIKEFIVRYRSLPNSLSNQTVQLASQEIQFTLDEISESLPDVKEKYASEFSQAYQKLHYYDAIALLHAGDRRGARASMKLIASKNISYFVIYCLLLLPITSARVLRILGR